VGGDGVLHNEVGAFTLFATHYHELTTLADELPRVANVHVAVAGDPEADSEDGVTFLRTIEPGATDRSYGVHVADLAGVPAPVVDRAGDVLRRLREDRAIEAKGGAGGSGEPVQAVFDLGRGEFRSDDGGADRGDDRGDRAPNRDATGERPSDPAASVDPALLEEIRGTELAEMSPVELMNRVREWQRRLDGE